MSNPLRQRSLPLLPVPRRLVPSRRHLLQAAVVSGLAGFVSSFVPKTPRRASAAELKPLLPRLREFQQELHRKARGWAIAGTLARKAEPGEKPITYAVDVAQLMWAFAMLRDAEPYHALRTLAQQTLIIDIKDDHHTRGFVPWRVLPGEKPDASGTTEALRLARALWTGADVFERPDDAKLALFVLDGYARHQTVDKGIWMIANYFNFGNRSAATNTFIIDYDADFVREVADSFRGKDEVRHREMSTLADNCYGVMRRAVSPSGLLYDLVQPELKTMYYGMDVSAFSPNDIIQINNTCTTAATVVRGMPEVARNVLSFFVERAPHLAVHYYGRNGQRVQDKRINAVEYYALARLAALLKNREAVGTFVDLALPFWERAVIDAHAGDCWTTSEMLIGLQSILDLA